MACDKCQLSIPRLGSCCFQPDSLPCLSLPVHPVPIQFDRASVLQIYVAVYDCQVFPTTLYFAALPLPRGALHYGDAPVCENNVQPRVKHPQPSTIFLVQSYWLYFILLTKLTPLFPLPCMAFKRFARTPLVGLFHNPSDVSPVFSRHPLNSKFPPHCAPVAYSASIPPPSLTRSNPVPSVDRPRTDGVYRQQRRESTAPSRQAHPQ